MPRGRAASKFQTGNATSRANRRPGTPESRILALFTEKNSVGNSLPRLSAFRGCVIFSTLRKNSTRRRSATHLPISKSPNLKFKISGRTGMAREPEKNATQKSSRGSASRYYRMIGSRRRSLSDDKRLTRAEAFSIRDSPESRCRIGRIRNAIKPLRHPAGIPGMDPGHSHPIPSPRHTSQRPAPCPSIWVFIAR